MKQKVPSEKLMEKDEKWIFNNVTNKYSFYCRLMENSINILSERNLNFGKTVETLNIDVIKPIDPSQPLTWPIKDLGSFTEWSCISIGTLQPTSFDKDFLPLKKTPENKSINWIICFEDGEQKEKMFTNLMAYKLLRQKEQWIAVGVREYELQIPQQHQNSKDIHDQMLNQR